MLDEYKLDRVYAWGHPDGLEGGRNEKAFADMMKSIEYAKAIGAKVMRVVRRQPHVPQRAARAHAGKADAEFTESRESRRSTTSSIADENHIDFNSDEMLSLDQGGEFAVLRDQLRHGQLHARAG